MLDAFLEVVHGKTKQAEAESRNLELMRQLPKSVLQKLAYGGSIGCGGGNESWLKQFEGTPLLDQAIAIEREELEIQMQEGEKRRAEQEVRLQFGDFDQNYAKRDELNIKRKLLELELVGGGAAGGLELGGQEGEDVAPELDAGPPAGAEATPPGPPGLPPAAPKGPPVAELAPEPELEEAGPELAGPPGPPTPPSAEGGAPPFAKGPPKGPPPPPKGGGEEESAGGDEGGFPPAKAEGEEKSKSDKPKTKITTVEKESEPKEKIDIKAAAARMRFSQVVKEAQLAGERVPFSKAAAEEVVLPEQEEAMARKAQQEQFLSDAPPSFRAGHFVGRNQDTFAGIGGGLAGGLGGIAAAQGLGAGVPGTIAGGLGGAALGYGIARAGGRFDQGVIAGQANAYPAKVASAIPAAATGRLGRGVELFTGSRARAIGSQAAGHNSQAQNSFKQYVATGRGHHEQDFMKHHTATRAARAAEETERKGVGAMRKDVGTVALAGGGTALGAAAATSGDKTAGVVDQLGSTVAQGTKKIRDSVKATQAAGRPAMSRNAKLVTGGIAAGGIGGIALGGGDKTASISSEREQQIKEAFGAALMSGLKGLKSFAGTAGKSIGQAAQAGGAQAAGQAAMNAGRSGLMRAGNFIAQNPGAGAAMIAAPALAAGYAAGRQ